MPSPSTSRSRTVRTASRAEVPGHEPSPVARTGARRAATLPPGAPGHRVHRPTLSTSRTTDAGTGVPAATFHGAGSGSPATTRNGTTPAQASVPSSGADGPPARALSSQRPR